MAANLPQICDTGGDGDLEPDTNPDQASSSQVKKLERKRDSIKNLLRILSKSKSSSPSPVNSQPSPSTSNPPPLNRYPPNSHATTHTAHTSVTHCQSVQQHLQLQYTNGDITKTITTTSSVTANIVKSDYSSDNIFVTGDFDNVIDNDDNNARDNNIEFAGDHIGDSDRQEGVNEDIIGYEHLWQLGTPGNVEDEDAISEVTETEDILDQDLPEATVDDHNDTFEEETDDREMYANTSAIHSVSATVDVEVPPPLPPRLPSINRSSSRFQDTRPHSEGGYSQSELSIGSNSQSELSRSSFSQSELGKSANTKSNQSGNANRKSVSQSALPVVAHGTGSSSSSRSRPITGSVKGQDFEGFSGGAVNCSSPNPGGSNNRSCLTSTPKDTSEPNLPTTVQQLRKTREEVLGALQSEEQERRWYYSQLQLIAQKISSIPPTSPNSYSLENEAARAELEERAARVQTNMQKQLGNPEHAIRVRRQRIQQVAEIDRQLSEMDSGAQPSAAVNPSNRQQTQAVNPSNRQQTPSTSAAVNLRSTNEEVSGGRRGHQQPQSCNLEALYHEAMPSVDRALSHSGPAAINLGDGDAISVMSFTSSVHSVGTGGLLQGVGGATSLMLEPSSNGGPSNGPDSLDPNSVLAVLGCADMDKMSKTLLAMSSSPSNCAMLRNTRCIPLLVQILHVDPSRGQQSKEPVLGGNRPARPVRARAARCLHNIVHAHPTEKQCKREAKVLKLLELVRQYCDLLRDILAAGEGRGGGSSRAAAHQAGCKRVTIQVVEGGKKYEEQDLMVADFGDVGEGFPVPCKQVYACQHFLDYGGEAKQNGQVINIEESLAVLTRCSFDENHRQPIFLLGGIPALAELIQVEHDLHPPGHHVCREVRRYAVVALTNLTFGNTNIKSYLCQYPGLIGILVGLLECQWETLKKATAHLFRNLAWKADKSSKCVLSESRVVSVLMACAMEVAGRCKVDTPTGLAVDPAKEEQTLKVILSALWNLSAHCRKNKSEVCSNPGALQLLVQLLRSRSTAIVENGGGILRNISSYIATSHHGEEYRRLLRDEDCLPLLLNQLGSPSLTIVSNSCGTLWNFSARNAEDQRLLWELGAVPMLQSLTNSKHKTISTCSLAALKNLYTANPAGLYMMASGVRAGQLTARKVKNMVADLDEKLSDNGTGGNDVEDGGNSRGNSGDESGSDADERQDVVLAAQIAAATGAVSSDRHPHHRSDSRASLSSSVPSVTSHYSERSRGTDRCSSVSPDQNENKPSGMGQHQIYPSNYASYNAVASASQRRAPPSNDINSGYRVGGSNSHLTSSGSSEVGINGQQYKNFMKQQQQYSDPSLGMMGATPHAQFQHHRQDNANMLTSEERVMSPSNLALSPGSIPLDLSKKPALTAGKVPDYVHLPHRSLHQDDDEIEPCDETPTNYSLRFQETEEPELLAAAEGSNRMVADTSGNAGSKMDDNNKSSANQLFDDSVKTYYTEGTPLDTPYNFSTATSLSDLRGEPAIPEEGEDDLDDDPEDIEEEEEEEMENDEGMEDQEGKADDTTVRYAVEGTPLTFSRADSLSSLDEDEMDNDGVGSSGSKLTAIPESGEEKGMAETEGSKHHKEQSSSKDNHRTVSFNNTSTNYAAEVATPSSMQLSRASSLASLESYNQHFTPLRSTYTSCATSNRASPTESDLPDSPTQPMPPAKFPPPPFQYQQQPPNGHHQHPPARPPPHQSSSHGYHHPASSQHLLPSSSQQPPLAPKFEKPMFSDDVKGFQEEGTPAVFSTRTSLSGLTFDDMLDDTGAVCVVPETNHESNQAVQQIVKEAWPETNDNININATKDANALHDNNRKDSDSSDESEEDIYADSESLLDQIIKKGMPSASTKAANNKNQKSPKSKIPQPTAHHHMATKPSHPVMAKLNESNDNNKTGTGSDDSCSSLDDSGDLLQACIASGMPNMDRTASSSNSRQQRSNNTSRSRSRQGLLGPRQAGEGAPATEQPTAAKLLSNQSKTSSATARQGGAVPPLPPERKGSHLSHPCVAAAAMAADLPQPAAGAVRYTARYATASADYSEDTLTTWNKVNEDSTRTWKVEDTPINFSTATSLSDLSVLDSNQYNYSGRISVDSQDGLLEHRRHQRRSLPAPRSRLASDNLNNGGLDTPPIRGHAVPGIETPAELVERYATEDTPAVFSRNDSLSSLEYEDIPDKGMNLARPSQEGSQDSTPGNYNYNISAQAPAAGFNSNLPRPLTVGRSASSGSSTGAPEPQQSAANKSLNRSDSSISANEEEDENLLADCIFSAMPKSKSEHFDLAGKTKRTGSTAWSAAKKSPRREKSFEMESSSGVAMRRAGRRSTSKSPRGSKIIPGVVIPELRLKPRTPPKSRPTSGDLTATAVFLTDIDTGENDNNTGSNDSEKTKKNDEQKLFHKDAAPRQHPNLNLMEDEPEVFSARHVNQSNKEINAASTRSCIQPTIQNQSIKESGAVDPKTTLTTSINNSNNKSVDSINNSTKRTNESLQGSNNSGVSSVGSVSANFDLSGRFGQLELTSSAIAREAGQVAAAFAISQEMPSLTGSEYSENCLSMVQPPSLMMESLPSLSQPLEKPAKNKNSGANTASPLSGSPAKRRPSDVKLECRHTVSGKVGSNVPLTVRRALGGSGAGASCLTGSGAVSQEDLSSLSSCQSNLDNIRPPTIMDDIDNMDHSMISVASLPPSEVVVTSRGSMDDNCFSLTSEAIMEIVRPAQEAVEEFTRLANLDEEHPSISCNLDSIQPPTALEDITLMNTGTTGGTDTLVPENGGKIVGGTYLIQNNGDEAGDETINDHIPDINNDDEISMQANTLTAGGSDAVDDGDIPDLPRDSSCGESSRETTPLMARKLSPRKKRQMYPERYLTYTKPLSPNSTRNGADDPSDTSGYRSQDTLSSREQRVVDAERFRTRTISREDIVPSSPQPSADQSSTPSPKTLKQRRADDAERYRTQTISNTSLVGGLNLLPGSALEGVSTMSAEYMGPMSPQEEMLLATEARLVVQTIAAERRSASVDLLRSISGGEGVDVDRSRSNSVEILKEHEMRSIDIDVGSIASRENLLDIQDPIQDLPLTSSLQQTGSSIQQPGSQTNSSRPRICKPWETRVADEEIGSPPLSGGSPTAVKGIRGRRRMLYSPPMKRATVPPAVAPKPTTTQTTKPRGNSSPVTSPKLVRGTRAMALRQANAAAKTKNENRQTSPKSPRRSHNTSGGSGVSLCSPRSLSSGAGSPSSKSRISSAGGGSTSRTQSPASPAERPGIVRQGTFTKDDPSPPTAANRSFVRSKSGIPRQTSGSSIPGRQASSTSLKGFNAGGSSQRTPPKVPPKPSMFPRRDTVQPSSCGPKPIVATTKTQQLREKSLTRGGLRGSNSSTSSVTSKASSTVSRTSIRTSSSSHSLRTAAEATPPKRTPSSSEIERCRSSGGRTLPSRPLSPISTNIKPVPARRGLSPVTTNATHRGISTKIEPVAGVKGPKKDVASKIASLWKKVEDSKKKDKKDSTGKDKRVWISKGKVQQQTGKQQQDTNEKTSAAAEGRLIRSGTYEKLTDTSIPYGGDSSVTDGGKSATKQRTRSRLSIKLSSRFGLKKRGSGLDTVNTATEDAMNGNTTAISAAIEDDLGNSVEQLASSPDFDEDDSTISSPRSGTGDLESPREEESSDTLMGPPPLPITNKLLNQPKKSATNIKRNSSYVSSLGRKLEDESSSGDSGNNMTLSAVQELSTSMTTSSQQKKSLISKTSSSVVTLV